MAEPSVGMFGAVRRRILAPLEKLGPGLVTGAADDDPSGIATYSQAGAQFGYGLLWTMILTYPLMSAVQLASAHVGRVTGEGLARSMVKSFPRFVVAALVVVLLVANTINIGADLSAMADSATLVTGGASHLFIIGFAVASTVLQLFVPYRRYAKILKWLTLSLFAYVGVLLLIHVDWSAALLGMLLPRGVSREALLTIVAVFGTTISPYLFFWQSSQEAEEVTASDAPPIGRGGVGASSQFRRMRIDTLVGMAFSNLIALSIMIAAASTLHPAGLTQIDTAAQAAEALRPIAGQFTFALFAVGIIGTGFLAVPVLAGSAAFAVSEVMGWKEGLEYAPREAIGFYTIIVVATVTGVLMDWSPVTPMQALFWSAVLNGIAAVPLMIALMVVVSSKRIMGRFAASPGLLFLGWAATLVMTGVSAALLLTSL